MRCSGTNCGKEGDGKFCEECGGKMVEEIMDKVVICSGKLEDDSACGAELVSNQKFCKSCGTKVDQSLFHSMQHTCPKCGNVVEQGAKFCMECGFNLKQQAKTEQPTIAVNESETSTKVDADKSKEEEDTQTSTASKMSSETGTACLGESKDKDGSIQDEEIYNKQKEESTAKNNESSVHVRDEQNYDKENEESAAAKNIESSVHVKKIENESDLKAGTVGQEVSFEAQPKIAENSNVNIGPTNEECTQSEATDDVEMADNQDGTANEEKDQREIEMACSGNRKIINENSNSELSEQLEDVHIGKGQQGNLNIVETLKTDAKEENVKETSNDSSKDEDIDDDTDEVQSNDNGQVKRSKNQKENEKKRKQDTDNAEMQTEHEANDDTVQRQDSSEQDKDSETGASSNEAEHIEQNIASCNRAVDQKTITDGEKGSQKEMVFGSHRSNGISESSEGNEIKTSYGKSLFTLNDTTDERTTTEQNRGNDIENNNESSSTANMDTTTDETFSYTNNLDEENEKSDKEGTDVDKATERETRSKTRAKAAELSKKPKQQEQLKKQSKAEENKVKATQRKFNEKCIKVQFHVLTSEDFKFDPVKDKCIVKIGHEEMGGWNRQDRVMKEKRKIDAYVYEMVFDEVIPTRLISGGPSITYKYVIIKGDKPDKERWEHYLNNYKSGKDVNRDLKVYLKLKGLDMWHQYDCFIENEKKSWTGRVVDYFTWKKDLIQHAEKAVEVFCPEIMENDKSFLQVEDVVHQLKMLLECMKKIYLLDGKCYISLKEYMTNMSRLIATVLMKKVNFEQQLMSDMPDKKVKTTGAALMILLVMKQIDLDLPDGKSQRVLAKALVVSADVEKKECPELQLANRIFQGKKKILLDAILAFIKQVCSTSKDPCWLCVLPLVHFLSDNCLPFQPPEVDVGHDKSQPTWWGIADIDKELDEFKKKRGNWLIQVEKMLSILSPLFEMDYLLPRSFLAAVDLSDLQKVLETREIPVEACLARLTYQLKVNKPETNYYDSSKLRDMSNAEKTVQHCINSLLTQLQETFYSDSHQLSSWTMCYHIASHMLKRSLVNNRVETIQLCVQVFIHCIAVYDRIMVEQKITGKGVDSQKNVLRENANDVVRHVEKYNRWDVEMKAILDVWNNIFAPVVLQSEDIRNTWNSMIFERLLQKLQNKVCTVNKFMQDFVELYCQKVDEYNPSMQDCMSKAAFLAIAKGYTVDYGRFLHHEYMRFGSLLSHMFISEWDKNVKTGYGEELSMLRHLLRWPPLLQYLKIYYKDEKKLEMLTVECSQRLTQAVSVIDSRLTALLTGAIVIGELSLIKEKEGKFPELAELVKTKTEHTAAFIRKAIEIRERELEAYQHEAQQMAIFASVCTHLANVDTSSIDDTLKKQEDLEIHQIREFCVPADITKVDVVDTYQPRLCAFKLSPLVLDVVPQLHACYTSNTFMMLWNAQCKEVFNQCSTLDDVVQNVWNIVKNQWDTITNKIKSGNIKFQDFEKLVSQKYRDNYDQMKAELRTMSILDNIIDKRIDQLRKYRQLETCVKGAKTILKFAKEYNLKGDFSQIRVIATHGETDQDMKSFNNTVMKACEFLKGLTPDKENCLKAFVKCGPLVQWLKESMETSGLKELKVFVDLAFMSAGDEPINIARVQCLHSAVTGYAPLIFDLDEDCGYKELLNLCDVVWKELEANPELPKKLLDTTGQLEWLKAIKQAHGSVEVTSLMQVEAINANGIFTLGKNTWKKETQTQQIDGAIMEMSDILKLTVPEQEGKRELKNYNFTQLQDLQSRLMLVAGKAEKGSDSVDRFTMIFDSITRLSSVYMKLSSSGCVLFKDWRSRFFCDPRPERPVCAILEFGQGDGAPQLKGKKTDTEGLQDIIPELANFMETCLEEWLKYIKEKRKNHLHLNYFTVDQLVILQRELVKMGSDLEPSHLIYPLLSAVKENCTPDDLLDSMTSAKEEIERGAVMEAEEERDQEEANTLTDSTEDEKKQNFVQELIQAGYEQTLAIKALDFVDPDDVTAGIVWCMDHEETDTSEDDDQPMQEKNKPVRKHLSQRPTFTGWSQSKTDIQSMITTNISGLGKQKTFGSEPLINDLEELWNKFLESISSNIRDYLSLEHLGLILKYLSMKETSEVCRSLPPGYKEGQPNLIICPSGDVLMTTLSIYMMDKDQPLPQSDEILMCTPNTTKDEVDIFWRRAIFDGGRKIHCLVNADMLDYDVSEAAERCLEEYLLEVHHNEDLNYHLLVICGSDNEYKSTMASSLDKFKRQPLLGNISHLREYLSTKLTVSQTTISGARPAASVDHQRYSVRVIKSWRAGVGKTLYKNRRETDVSRLNKRAVNTVTVSIPLQEKTIDLHYLIERLLEHTAKPDEVTARLFHIDVAHEVENGVDYLLFNLLLLGCLTDKTGFVWRKSPTDLYLIETMPLMMQTTNRKVDDLEYAHPMLNILPDLTCRSPQESLQIYSGVQLKGYKDSDQLFDEQQFRSPVFQRTFQYLLRLDQRRQLDDVQPDDPEEDPETCLQTLLRHCGLEDPSWSELHHFVWFLNTQLVDFENNMFVSAAAAEDLPGFSKFVLRFLIQMSRDFSTRSLDMKEESPGLKPKTRENNIQMEIDVGENESDIDDDDDVDEEDSDEEENNDDSVLQAYQMRRTWESSPHPYLFFNSDRFSFTFLGFYIEKSSGNLIDQQTGKVLERGIMTPNLYDSLVRNHAPIQENFDNLPRHEKILKLCKCMGLDMPHDPDDTYELTTDNVKKIMAIYMRFRCDIPVIIMGETGCGKTRLVKFMCSLQQPPGVNMTNMILMKVHGGTTNKDIIRKVKQAEKIAQTNKDEYGDQVYTVLFFDEANTTEAIGLIKEIMCDKSMEGKKLKLCENLKMVAACNPYRKHSDKLIKKLEQAGLGYHVDADETTDRLGRVPMRRLVYRVQPLPQSLLPLVWDFGQLNTQVEDLYIRQMVRRYIRDDKLPDVPGLIEVVSSILTASQEYMREQKDECSFVSLRDVDRVLTVMSWFYQQSQGNNTLFNLIDRKLGAGVDNSLFGMEEEEDEQEDNDEDDIVYRQIDDHIDNITRSLILAVGICYHACLKTRQQYREHISRYFTSPCELHGGEEQIQEEIENCQEVFLDHVHLEKNIARNMALRENVFMMIVCIELRIPLFLVGKPGSSKSLAKTIVSDAMQGNNAKEKLFKEFKQAQMVSFQCSPLATPDTIVATFRQCAQFQKDKDLDTFVSIVVLDEVGLAEDSPRMPLKTLHPLLEDGCQGDEEPEKHMKVAFIGISNWALDPAKMNRGILVQREVPDLEELKNSANGICQTEDELGSWIKPLIEPMAISYLDIFERASKNMREFYGLRDFYSLVKMVYWFVEQSKQRPTWYEMLHAILRNFGGLDEVNPVKSFKENLSKVVHFDERPKRTDPDCSPAGLVQACLFDSKNTQSESRYLLLLTENYGTLTIIQQQILSRRGDIRPITIFGSSFRSDQEYTQVCRNINKIKVCMETGNTVVLLNLENLYESLYDALNQYYVYFGGERYVDLGLGTHRVKCPVHKDFRLIVVAEKQTVYKKFPIPLINRLEKHFLTINTMLSLEQQRCKQKLENWAKEFVKQRKTTDLHQRKEKSETEVGDVFIGYHDDTCSAIVLDVWEKPGNLQDDINRDEQVLQYAKLVLLWCATPESLVRLDKSSLSNEEKKFLVYKYFEEQSHDNFIQYIKFKIVEERCEQIFTQITTHSKLMAGVHKKEISKACGIRVDRILLLETLSSFDTEQQFSNRIQQHIQTPGKEPSLMVIQCDSGDVNANLIACARYCVMDEYEKMRGELQAPVHVVFIVQLPRGASFTGFQCGVWQSVHIDDLYTADMNMPKLRDMQDKSVAKIFSDAVTGGVAMETEDTMERENVEVIEDMELSGNEAGNFSPRPGSSKGNDWMRMETEEVLGNKFGIGKPLQLHDVLFDLKHVGTHRTSPRGYGQNRQNVEGLVLACVQAALSMVKDKEENTSKETDRVALVLKLMYQDQDEGQASFLHGICCLIAKLLEEKESRTHIAYMAKNWLINEAASKENINKAGTFRRSCIQTLETKVAPILAGIIAYLDTNDNIKILQEDCDWKQKLFLTILNTVDAISLKFADLQSPTRKSDLQEVVVMTTGCEGHLFSARMPFSWLLINKINDLLKLPLPVADSNEHDEDEDIIKSAEFSVNILSEQAIGKVLSCINQQEALTDALQEYLHDFVHTMYHAASGQEHQLVCQSVLYLTTQMANTLSENSLLHSLVTVHIAYQKLASRLTYFRAMNSVWPECSSTIVDLKASKPDHFMFKEQEF
ncbi:E3 ubiquitin-protein ligase rnf213-alpha-like, partial [Ruditapes philippinarum]|uniref:E3 ubiquitin-protein ligase rnf213-alpha-like n=1 Tax=Ruditapes philippinarum TaxID=129788 RepID=UPI00295C2755